MLKERRMRALTGGLAFAAAALAFAPAPVAALGGHWQPAGIRPSGIPLATVLAKASAAAGAPAVSYAERVEHWILSAGTTSLTVTVSVRGADLRFDTAIDGATYSQGRNNGNRWRRTPNGVVRLIGADVQGDDLDRWPLALFPYAASDCSLLGEALLPAPAWVIEYRPAYDSPHWFYYDEPTGRLVREIFREGSRNVTFDFSDVRTIDGASRPFAWHVSGKGGDADVKVADIVPQAIETAAVALPLSSDPPSTSSGPSVAVPARFFAKSRALVDVTVNGKHGTFIFDTGTTQILIASEAAQRFGLRPIFGHAIARELSTGGITFHDIATQTVSLAAFQVDGILGYDYFCGHIVHLDYGNGRIDLIAPGAFTPPPGAFAIPANFDEGMPLVAATIGSAKTSRVALDTGSENVLVLRVLYGGDPAQLGRIGIKGLANIRGSGFLEGPIDIASAQVAEIDFAGNKYLDDEIEVEVQAHGAAVDFPIDAIFGTQVLHKYEMWFDYDDGRIWLRPE
jgi:Aspartyl protease